MTKKEVAKMNSVLAASLKIVLLSYFWNKRDINGPFICEIRGFVVILQRKNQAPLGCGYE